jgi:hypothetical protein
MVLCMAAAAAVQTMAPIAMVAHLYGVVAAAVVLLVPRHLLGAHHLLVGMVALGQTVQQRPQERLLVAAAVERNPALLLALALLAKSSSQFSRLDRGLT